MDKNQIIGIVLIIALIFGYQYFFAPEPVEPDPQEQTQTESGDSTAQPETKPEIITPAPVAELDSATRALLAAQEAARYGIFSASVTGEEQDVVLENEKVRIVLSTRGGMFKSAELKEFQGFWSKENIQLWDEQNSSMDLAFSINGKGEFKSSDFSFVPEGHTPTASSDSPAQVSMKLKSADPSRYLNITYSLQPDSYEVTCNVEAIGLQRDLQLDPSKTRLVWDAMGWHNEKGISNERNYSAPFFREMEEDRDYLNERSDEDEEILEGSLNWMTFKQHFFSAMVISESAFAPGAKMQVFMPEESDTLHTKRYVADLPLNVQSGQAVSVPMKFYLGPNRYQEMKDLEIHDGVRIIDYGWSIFGWVNRNFIRPVYTWLSSFIGSAGLIILLLTIFIKMLLFPITWKNYLSSAKMKVIRPEIEELNTKFKDKPAVEKQQAQMELYRKTGVSPFSGCIPLLLQMPILYAMFRFFPSSIELRGKSFLWADDLSAYDAIVSWTGDFGFVTTMYGNHVSGFTVLMAASTFFYTRMNASSMPQQSQPGMPNMKIIMNIFPFMMLIFFNQFASGLSFYYFIANLLSIAQMWVIKKYIIDEKKIRAKIEVNKKKPKKKKSGFQQRLEEMQKQQQQNVKKPKGKR